jgi:hypothetical protein
MQITNFGHFQTIIRSPRKPICFENELGQDWYDMRKSLTTWDYHGEFVNAVYGAWALVDENGVVTNVEQDPSRLMPGDRTVLGIDADPEDIEPGMVWDGKQLLARETVQ